MARGPVRRWGPRRDDQWSPAVGWTVGRSGSTGSTSGLDAAAWYVSTDGVTPMQAFVGGPGDQATTRASIDRDRLVAVDMTVMTRPSGLSAAATTPGSDSATRTHSGRRRTGDAPCGTDRRCRREPVADRGRLPEGGDDEDGAVWITRDDEGRGWERITGDGLPFVGRVVSDSSTSPGCGTAVLIAVGYAESDDGNGLDAAFWLSDDGRTWTQGELAVAFGGPGDRTTPSERFGGVGRPAVIIAVGKEDRTDPGTRRCGTPTTLKSG